VMSGTPRERAAADAASAAAIARSRAAVGTPKIRPAFVRMSVASPIGSRRMSESRNNRFTRIAAAASPFSSSISKASP
jgi:hypothetical protein